MSLILEALRKSEAERRRGGAPDLLQAEVGGASGRRSRVPAWAWAAPVLLVIPLALWWPRGTVTDTASVASPVAGQAPAPAQHAPAATRGLPPVAHLQAPSPPPAPAPAAQPTAPVQALAATTPTPTTAPIATHGGAPIPLGALPPDRRKALPPLRLSMHLWNDDPSRRAAILDGRRVAAGDRVGDAIVAEIRRDGVLLEWDGERVLVPLP